MEKLLKVQKLANNYRILFIIIAIALLAVVSWFSPAKLAIIGYKVSLVTIAAILGYFVSYLLFPNYRPGELDKEYEEAPNKTTRDHIRTLQVTGVVARAVIIFACILGITLGL